MRRALSIAALVLAIGFAWLGLDRLATARRAEARAVQVAPEPVFAFPAGGTIVARDAERAAGTLARRVADAASATGVRLESRPAEPPMGGFVALDAVVIGPEPAVRSFARRLEGGPVVMRLIVATMRPVGGGVLLRARAMAPWRR